MHHGIRIDISTDNDAFRPNPGQELARILRDLAEALDNDGVAYTTLRDINGNPVGTMAVA